MAGDPSLLALVLDDPLAPRVLAWWSATKAGSRCNAGRLGSGDLQTLLRVTETSGPQLEVTLERCRYAGLLDGKDGGISEWAAKWLGSIVAERLGAPKKPPKKPPKKKKPAP